MVLYVYCYCIIPIIRVYTVNVYNSHREFIFTAKKNYLRGDSINAVIITHRENNLLLLQSFCGAGDNNIIVMCMPPTCTYKYKIILYRAKCEGRRSHSSEDFTARITKPLYKQAHNISNIITYRTRFARNEVIFFTNLFYL